jgi:hypothetical protein
MNDHIPSRPVSAAQIAGIMTFTLALFFMVAFATNSVDAYRLRAWRDRLGDEIAEMERERLDLEQEVRRRQSPAWIDQVLRDSGWVPPDVVSVIAIPVQGSAPAVGGDAATSTDEPARAVAPALSGDVFDNENWRAWQGLIWGFDAD